MHCRRMFSQASTTRQLVCGGARSIISLSSASPAVSLLSTSYIVTPIFSNTTTVRTNTTWNWSKKPSLSSDESSSSNNNTNTSTDNNDGNPSASIQQSILSKCSTLHSSVMPLNSNLN